MHAVSTSLIIGLLIASVLFGIEAGYRVGNRFRGNVDASTKSQIKSLQASMLGILALLLGFTYSLSLERFDARSDALVEEALAIDNVHFRAKVLPPTISEKARRLIGDYLALRIDASEVALDQSDERLALIEKADTTLAALSQCAVESVSEDDSMVHSGLFLESLKELTDALGRREAALQRRVPDLVLYLLFATVLLTGFVVGHASGIEGHRVAVTTYALAILIFLVVYLIVDLDRPRRGLIQVRHQSLTTLDIDNHLSDGRD